MQTCGLRQYIKVVCVSGHLIPYLQLSFAHAHTANIQMLHYVKCYCPCFMLKIFLFGLEISWLEVV